MDCLNDIIKFKSLCSSGYKGRYVEDFVQVDNVLLDNLANESEITGKKYGISIIDSAVQSVLSDIYTSYGNMILENSVETLAFAGNFNSLSMKSGGFSIRDLSSSTMTKLQIKSIRIKPLFDGSFTVVIDDGKNIQEYDLTGGNNIEASQVIDYETSSKLVKVYIKDGNQEFSQITATNKGCSSCSGNKYNMTLQPLKNGAASNVYSTMIPEAYLICDSSNFMCLLLKNPVIKQSVIKAIAIQSGIIVYERLMLSTRFNDKTVNINKEAAEMYLNTLVGKYQEFVFGANYASGVKRSNNIHLTELIKRNIKSIRDICVSCNATFQTSTVIF